MVDVYFNLAHVGHHNTYIHAARREGVCCFLNNVLRLFVNLRQLDQAAWVCFTMFPLFRMTRLPWIISLVHVCMRGSSPLYGSGSSKQAECFFGSHPVLMTGNVLQAWAVVCVYVCFMSKQPYCVMCVRCTAMYSLYVGMFKLQAVCKIICM